MQTGLVGREPELAMLRGCLEAALEGHPRMVACLGEPGIGKTRLAEELLTSAAAQGVLGVWGVAVDAEGAPPYWPWRQVLRAVGNGIDLAAIAAEHRLTADLANLAPDIFAGSADLADAESSMEDRFRLFDAVTMLLRHLTHRDPLAIVLDDAHSADQASLLLLQHVARSARAERLLVVVNSRDTEQTNGAVFAELLREPVTRHIRLGGLAAPAVGQHLASVIGHEVGDADVAHVHELTGGNPFFVSELAKALADRSDGTALPITWNLREAVGARLSRLSADSVALLRAASIVGREFSAAVPAAMLGLPVLRCLALLDEAASAGLVEVPSLTGQHRFAHALLRDAIEAGLGTPERVHLHRLAAGALEQLYGDQPGPHLFDLARHWAVAAVQGDKVRATVWIERAGNEAMRRHAYEESAQLFRLALDVGTNDIDQADRCRLLLGLGPALYLSCDLPGGLEACVEAAALAADMGRPDLVAQAALVTEPTFQPESDLVIRQLCEQAIAVLDASHAPLRAVVLARLAEVCMYLGDDETARVASEESLTLAEQCGEQAALVAALKARQEVCSGPDTLEERADLAERMLAVGRGPASPNAALSGHLARIDAALERGHLSVVAREIEAAARCAQEIQGRSAHWLLLRSQSVLAQAQARFDDARRLAEEAFSTIAPLGHPTAPVVWAGFLSTTAHHVGHDAESLASNGLANATADELDFPTAGVIRALAPAVVLAETGRIREASAIY
nr:AAA family ATPase [Nocardioidaceae bacterium]